ncbi:hypothetical protein RhiirA5_385215 [Rhizophagus irregularis]|uniref:Uncharacterized protein n=1 Tax=Rhizophagus irregularis TaxID=588596 RepID=A0A2N0NQ04_9GLOM|nr:hypothetical protein RhiirA5_385215 [Rhizophagus irregularis]
MKPDSNKTLWGLLVIFTSVLTIFVTTYVSAYTINTYNHSEGDAYISPIGYFTLIDGSQLLRFYRPLNNGKCNEPDLHIRLLHVNGTMTPLVVQNFSIPKFNFCRVDTDVLSSDYIIVTNLGRNNLFYILYYNISDTDYSLPFGRFIAEVDLDGNILGLKIKDHQQVDSSTKFEQLIIPLQIEPTRNLSQRNTNNLYHDLNHMILNKQYTEISNYQYASLLDQSYGYKLNAGIKDIIRDNKETILAAIVVFFIIIIVFLWAKRKGESNKVNEDNEENEENEDEERSNMIILKVGLSLMDFVLDGLVIFAFASIFNLILAMSLIISENFKHDNFKEWLKKNSIVASIFTLFSATNVEVLNILSSKIGGFKMFSANFMDNTISIIFWSSIVNFVVKDIPQFGIQVYYITHIISYNVIPFLTLVTSSAMIVLNIIGKSYNIMIECQKRRDDDDDDDDEDKEAIEA